MKKTHSELYGFHKLWAPWRMKYIEEIGVDTKVNCIFCDKPHENDDEKNYIVHRSSACYIILNVYPYNNGHIMIVPYEHTTELAYLDSETRLDLMSMTILSMEVIKKVMRPDGFNVGVNFGRVAGAGIDDHLHIHLVPRWNGDTNFMPVIGCTKVISESLEDTYKKLRNGIKNINKEE